MSMDDETVKNIKELLEQKTKEIQQDIDMTITTMLPEEIFTFENRFYGDYEYYEGLYANEETVRSNIEKLFGCFPIEYILSDVIDYINKRVYMCALHDYIREQDL